MTHPKNKTTTPVLTDLAVLVVDGILSVISEAYKQAEQREKLLAATRRDNRRKKLLRVITPWRSTQP